MRRPSADRTVSRNKDAHLQWSPGRCPGNVLGCGDSLQAKLEATKGSAEPVGEPLSPHRISCQWQKALAPPLDRRQACVFIIHRTSFFLESLLDDQRRLPSSRSTPT